MCVKERERQMLGCPLHENRPQPVNTGAMKCEEKQGQRNIKEINVTF